MTSKEALNRLKFIADKELNTGSKSYKDLQEFWNYKEPLKVIEYLVERDTPMKVNIKTYTNGFFMKRTCSVCGSTIQKEFVYCPMCGQKIDWSDENE